jgi:hypothetical protein
MKIVPPSHSNAHYKTYGGLHIVNAFFSSIVIIEMVLTVTHHLQHKLIDIGLQMEETRVECC